MLDTQTIVAMRAGVVVWCERLVGMDGFSVDMSQATYSLPELAPRQGRLRYGGHEGSPPLAIGNKGPQRLRPDRCTQLASIVQKQSGLDDEAAACGMVWRQ